MPMQTSQERQYQLSTLDQVGSEFTFCQFKIVRTIQQAAVLFRNCQDEVEDCDKLLNLHKTKTHKYAKPSFDADCYLNLP